MTTVQMRPEARPLRLKVLDYYQKEAIERISGLLLEALGTLKGDGCSSKTPEDDLDPYRASRLFFLSGEAGGGKTTTYVSLRHALGPFATEPDEEDLKYNKHGDKKIEKFKKLWPNREKLIWLEPLDLESAPESHNFLAATLVRIEKALFEKTPEGRRNERRRGVLEAASDGARQKFESLRNDVVLAWEGNLRERAERTDSDTYFLEVLRSANASLRINARFREALHELMREDERFRESLFILPVEDFYLNPSSSLELLRLLRMISVPRLFVVILGDYIVAEELVYQDMLGKLVGMAGEQAFLRLDRQRERLTAMAGAVSARSLRKLVPAAQSYRLQVMYQLGALDFHPDMLDPDYVKLQGDQADAETLEKLLEKLLLSPERPPQSPSNLHDFLLLRSAEQERKGHQYYTYSGLAVLDLPPREVVDLWYSAKRALEAPPEPEELEETDKEEAKKKMEERRRWKATLGLVVRAAFDAISAQDYLTKEEQDTCSAAISGSWDYEKSFDTSALRVEPNLKQTQVKLKDGGTVVLSELQGWLFYPKVNKSKTQAMAPRPTAWMTVLHDLMVLSGEDRLVGDPLTPEPFEFGLVRVVRENKELFWPTPCWISFWHFDRLGFKWREVVRKAKELKRTLESEKLCEWMAYHWLRYIADSLLDSDDLAVKPKKTVVKKDWKDLGADLQKLLTKTGTAEERLLWEEWLLRLAVVFTPELNEYFGRALEPLWSSKTTEIQAIRKKAIRNISNETPAS